MTLCCIVIKGYCYCKCHFSKCRKEAWYSIGCDILINNKYNNYDTKICVCEEHVGLLSGPIFNPIKLKPTVFDEEFYGLSIYKVHLLKIHSKDTEVADNWRI